MLVEILSGLLQGFSANESSPRRCILTSSLSTFEKSLLIKVAYFKRQNWLTHRDLNGTFNKGPLSFLYSPCVLI